MYKLFVEVVKMNIFLNYEVAKKLKTSKIFGNLLENVYDEVLSKLAE